MAPIPPDSVENRLQDVIQDLFEIQSAVHGYLGPETQQVLVQKVPQLAGSLASLSKIASTIPTKVPPGVIDEFIDEGRNPDIYTRMYIESVQKVNRQVKGQCEAFANFTAVLADEITKAVPELKDDVTRILSGGPVGDAKKENGHSVTP